MKVAMISSWHVHAKGYAKDLLKIPNCEIVAVWDENKQAGITWAEELGCKFYENYDELLKDKNIDGVCVNSPTNMHPELILKAAEAKKHIFTEKVLSIATADALKIKQAIVKNNVKFTISFPHRCRGDILYAKQLADSGALGKINYARVRNAHDGSSKDWLPPHFYNKEQCGGGAMVDLGAHTIYLLNFILGMPKSTTSTFTSVTDRGVEDNAVTVMEFANGAIGVAETGFVSSYSPFSLEIIGTKGSVLVRDGVSYANEQTEGKWVNVTDIPTSLKSPLVQWVDSVTEDKPVLFDIDAAVALTQMMEAAYKGQK